MKKIRSFRIDDQEFNYLKACLSELRATKSISDSIKMKANYVADIKKEPSEDRMQKSQTIKENLTVAPDEYVVSRTMAFPRLKEWDEWLSYDWVFTRARANLVKDFDGQSVKLEIIKRYVQEQADLIE